MNLVAIIFIMIMVFTNSVLVSASITDKIPELFFQSQWVDSPDKLIIYLLNFHQIDRKTADYFSLSTYFSEFSAESEVNWSYSREENLLELTGLLSNDNTLTIERYQSLLNSQDDYISWLFTSNENPVQVRLEERHIVRNEVEQVEGDLLNLSITPLKTSYETGEILTKIEFYIGRNALLGKEEGRVITYLFLDDKTQENIAVVSRKIKTEQGEETDYYILQMAAAFISAEEYADLNKGLLTIGDIGGFNKLMENDNSYIGLVNRRPVSRKLALKLGNCNTGLEFRQAAERFSYIVELNKLFAYKEIDYLINFNYYLDDLEDISLSLQLANELTTVRDDQNNNLYLPVFRAGLSDQVKWTDKLSVGLFYYPIVVSKRDIKDNLWELKLIYEERLWNLEYSGEFLGDIPLQKLIFTHSLERGDELSLACSLDEGKELNFSFSYIFNL